MKRILINIVCGIATLFGACAQNEGYETLSAQAFAQKLEETPTIQLLDVRTADEYGQGHIEKALNLDVKQANFSAQADSLLDKARPVAVYCRSGVRSQQAARQLVQLGFVVYNLKGGYLEWKASQK